MNDFDSCKFIFIFPTSSHRAQRRKNTDRNVFLLHISLSSLARSHHPSISRNREKYDTGSRHMHLGKWVTGDNELKLIYTRTKGERKRERESSGSAVEIIITIGEINHVHFFVRECCCCCCVFRASSKKKKTTRENTESTIHSIE